MKKISVIVPIYKVEQYLEKCIESIRNQTYENLEIILVDDGSPDNCGALCDKFAESDNRIKVIHKENGGLSSARNAGIDIATGEYIAFVDSDDWLEFDFFEVLEKLLMENNADFSVCGLIDDYTEISKLIRNGNSLSSIASQKEIFWQIISNPLFYGYACNKLFKKEMLGTLRFDESLMSCEDIDFCVRIAAVCRKASYTPEKLYHYRHHALSMTGEFTYSPRKLSVLKAYENIMPYYEKYCPEMLSIIKKNYLKIAINIKGRILLNKVKDNKVSDMLNSIIEKYYKTVLTDKSINALTKLNIILSKNFPSTLLFIKQKILKLRSK